MASGIAWIDRDNAARQRSLQLISLFNTPDSRDELGVGSVRDAVADILFPGTSTIQTRLRYMFHVPWSFAKLESRRVPSEDFPAAARQAEVALMKAFRDAGVKDFIGSDAGSDLKRLPSSVYWAGLGSWNLRRFDGSQEQYFSAADRLYEARKSRRKREGGDDHDADFDHDTWHPRLLKLMPDNYPVGADMRVTADEANFLLDMWSRHHPGSLLTWLAQDAARRGSLNVADEIWAHPRRREFPAGMLRVVDHAHRFAVLVRSAAYLYNLQLAELDVREDLVTEYRDKLAMWTTENAPLLTGWSVTDLWRELLDYGKPIDLPARNFCEQFFSVVKEVTVSVADDQRARRLVEQRERNLKKVRSRFTNPSARRQWSGAAGIGLLSYRWPTARRFLTEWHEGLRS